MFQWIYNRSKEARRFIDENVRQQPKVNKKDTRLKEIYTMAMHNGMKQSDINSLLREIDSSKLAVPQSTEDKVDQLYYIMNLLLDDLNFDTAEKDFIKEFAVTLGIPISKAPYIIMEIYTGMRDEKPEIEVRERIYQMLA